MTTTSSAVIGTAISTDGTSIAWQRQGTGPGLVLVDAVLFDRSTSPSAELIDPLAETFTVISYDRRGKGASGDTRPWAPAREAEESTSSVCSTGWMWFLPRFCQPLSLRFWRIRLREFSKRRSQCS